MRRLRAIGTAGGASLIAVSLLLAPALAATTSNRAKAARTTLSLGAGRTSGPFTPAVSDPRLAAALARRGTSLSTAFRLTPAAAANERSRRLQISVRGNMSAPIQAARDEGVTSASDITAITPSSYNLGVSLGWRRFALSGDVAQTDNGLIQGRRESAQVGMSYRATRHITGRVAVAAERAEGNQRLLAEDQAYMLDVGGAYSIARNVDVTAGARYRISRDRLEPVANTADRRDSQAVYIGTAFRF